MLLLGIFSGIPDIRFSARRPLRKRKRVDLSPLEPERWQKSGRCNDTFSLAHVKEI
jgi:hypothetical protein